MADARDGEIAALRAEVAALREEVRLLRAVVPGTPADWQQGLTMGATTTIRPWPNAACAGAAPVPVIVNVPVQSTAAWPAAPFAANAAAGGGMGQTYIVAAP